MALPGRPSNRDVMVMTCTPSSIERLTSNNSKAVAVIASQQISMTASAGKNPLIPVAIGNANIPPPIQVPATKNIADNIFPLWVLFSIATHPPEE